MQEGWASEGPEDSVVDGTFDGFTLSSVEGADDGGSDETFDGIGVDVRAVIFKVMEVASIPFEAFVVVVGAVIVRVMVVESIPFEAT